MTAQKIDKALDRVLKHEGRYQKLKEDKGNYNSKGQLVGTKYGISALVYEEATGDVPSEKDMRTMSKEEARDIYKAQYVRPVTDNLGVDVDHPAFEQTLDIVVNHGYGNAVPIIQRALGIKVDGKSGPATRQAIAQADPVQFNNALVEKREEFYDQIIQQDPTQSSFEKGWKKRAESFRLDEPTAEIQEPAGFGGVPSVSGMASPAVVQQMSNGMMSHVPATPAQVSPLSPFSRVGPEGVKRKGTYSF